LRKKKAEVDKKKKALQKELAETKKIASDLTHKITESGENLDDVDNRRMDTIEEKTLDEENTRRVNTAVNLSVEDQMLRAVMLDSLSDQEPKRPEEEKPLKKKKVVKKKVVKKEKPQQEPSFTRPTFGNTSPLSSLTSELETLLAKQESIREHLRQLINKGEAIGDQIEKNNLIIKNTQKSGSERKDAKAHNDTLENEHRNLSKEHKKSRKHLKKIREMLNEKEKNIEKAMRLLKEQEKQSVSHEPTFEAPKDPEEKKSEPKKKPTVQKDESEDEGETDEEDDEGQSDDEPEDIDDFLPSASDDSDSEDE